MQPRPCGNGMLEWLASHSVTIYESLVCSSSQNGQLYLDVSLVIEYFVNDNA